MLRQAVQQDRADAALQLAVMAERGEVAIDRSELIHLWALAEARSTERERARRSLQRLGAQGATAEIEQARSVVAQRQTVLDNERSAAREAREAALRRLAAAAAQPSPSQPSVGAAPSPVAVVPSPASGTASIPPSHGAGPVSSSATPTAGLELLMGDRFAWAGIALGVALGVGGVGFWLGRRRGQQALKAAQALQRRTAVSAPSIADAYLAAKQAHAASASADMTKLGVDAPTPQRPPTADNVATGVSGTALSPADAFRLGVGRAQAVAETPPLRSAAMEVTGPGAQAKRGKTLDPAGMAESSSAGAEGTRDPQPEKVGINSERLTEPTAANRTRETVPPGAAGDKVVGSSSYSVGEESVRDNKKSWSAHLKMIDDKIEKETSIEELRGRFYRNQRIRYYTMVSAGAISAIGIVIAFGGEPIQVWGDKIGLGQPKSNRDTERRGRQFFEAIGAETAYRCYIIAEMIHLREVSTSPGAPYRQTFLDASRLVKDDYAALIQSFVPEHARPQFADTVATQVLRGMTWDDRYAAFDRCFRDPRYHKFLNIR